MSATKTERINLRATARQESLLRRAADVDESTMSDFILSSAVERAEHLLADRRWFVATPEQFEAFVEVFDAEPDLERMARLFSRDSVFDAPFRLEDR